MIHEQTYPGTPCGLQSRQVSGRPASAGSGGGESLPSERTASKKAVPGFFNYSDFADYRARVQRIFDTHRKPIMPSAKLLRDCYFNQLPPKSVYRLVMEIASE